VLYALDVAQPVPTLVGRLGITVPDGVALDKRVVFPFWDRPIPQLTKHPSLQGLRDGRLTPVLAHPAPLVRSDPMPDGVQATALLTTTRDGWIERGGPLESGVPVYDPEIDGAGPVDLAIALQLIPGKGVVRTGKNPARVVVIGDGDVFTNALLGDGPGNATLALEMIHWLAGADNRVASVGARKGRVRRLALTKEQMGSVRWLSMGFLPFLVALIGFVVRFGRRGR